MQLSKPPKPKATRKRLKKEILSDDYKKRKIFWKNIAENFWKIFRTGKFSTSHHYFNVDVWDSRRFVITLIKRPPVTLLMNNTF
jgi:hypothetical protein